MSNLFSRKRPLSFLPFLFLFVIAITGCQKKFDKIELLKPETHVQIVTDSIARAIAENFNPVAFFNTANPTNHSPLKSKLNGHNVVKNIITIKDKYYTPAIYVCNFTDNQGFLFVSADFQIAPVLAYIEVGEFKKDKVPSALVSWADKTIENIEKIRTGLYNNVKEAKTAWDSYLSQNKIINTQIQTLIQSSTRPFYISVLPGDPVPPPNCVPTYQTILVGPLLPVTWGQGCTYNDLSALNQGFACNLGCGNGRPYTGCVATASAQVIRYWQPQGLATYDYASMPATFGNSEVQRLMADAGYSTNMSYGCDGSSAYATDVPYAFKYSFSLPSANYDDYKWWVTAGNLDNHWPVLLDACTEQTYHSFIITWWTYGGACHEWVADGYKQDMWTTCNTTGVSAGLPTYNYGFLYLHMNWGWHEVNITTDFNGWFMDQNWNISGKNLNFQYGVSETTNIHP